MEWCTDLCFIIIKNIDPKQHLSDWDNYKNDGHDWLLIEINLKYGLKISLILVNNYLDYYFLNEMYFSIQSDSYNM